MLPGMSDEPERVPVMLRWSGRLLPVAGVVYGMYPDSVCGSAFFPDGGMDEFTRTVCTGPLADRRGLAILLLFLGFAALGASQVIGWRKKPGAEG